MAFISSVHITFRLYFVSIISVCIISVLYIIRCFSQDVISNSNRLICIIKRIVLHTLPIFDIFAVAYFLLIILVTFIVL